MFWLERDMRIPWVISHCVSVEEAKSRVSKADIVILKPEMEGLSSPKEVFRNIDDMVFEIPIIVLIDAEDEHEFSTFVMERGAADIVIRGQFARFVDAIEFALIRQKTTTDTRKAADKILANREEIDVAEQEKQRQILRMFSGDYAVDQQGKTTK